MKNFKCNFCDKSFGDSKTLKDHVKAIHEVVRDHICDSCGQGFKLQKVLIAHIRGVHGERNHKCDICGQAFKLLKTLKQHVKYVHDKVKEHACTHCGKMFGKIFNMIQLQFFEIIQNRAFK